MCPLTRQLTGAQFSRAGANEKAAYAGRVLGGFGVAGAAAGTLTPSGVQSSLFVTVDELPRRDGDQLALPARSPNLNAYAERWVRSVKVECLSKVILFGEHSLRRALNDYVEHFHAERNHQGKDNVLLFPLATDRQREGPLRCHERLGGLLRYYHREAA